MGNGLVRQSGSNPETIVRNSSLSKENGRHLLRLYVYAREDDPITEKEVTSSLPTLNIRPRLKLTEDGSEPTQPVGLAEYMKAKGFNVCNVATVNELFAIEEQANYAAVHARQEAAKTAKEARDAAKEAAKATRAASNK